MRILINAAGGNRPDATLPPGLLAKLKGVGKCPDQAIAVGIPLAILVYGWFAPGPATRATQFTVAEGSSVSGVAAELDRAGLIASVTRFKVGARVFGGNDPVQAGEFEIPKGASASAMDSAWRWILRRRVRSSTGASCPPGRRRSQPPVPSAR